MVVGVGGCWAQSVKDEVFARFPFVDVAFGPGQVHKLAEFLTSDSLTAQGFFEFESFTGRLPAKRARELPRVGPDQRRLQLRVLVLHRPVHARAARSRRPPSELVARSGGSPPTASARSRCSDRTSTPTAATCRGNDRASFAELLAVVDGVEGIERIRYTSPHPKDMREDVIRAHAELPALCEHIHLPLQSGSSPILKRMRRTYTRERYLDRVAMIREHVPDCAITTGIIVGFPGETDEDFERTRSRSPSRSATTVRSRSSTPPRRGTEAATLPGQVSHELKVERMVRLVEVVQRRAHERAQRFVGRTLEVLVEGPSRTDPTPPARPLASQQGRQLRRRRRARGSRGRRDRGRNQPDAVRFWKHCLQCPVSRSS